jgi:2-keto-4-pentenoate hydratase/2-oxohepta-3-ene-1,7-dioic acid hydratase in catechol pathway
MTIWCRYQAEDGPSFGIVSDERVQRIDGDPFSFHCERSESIALRDAKLLPPIIPPTFYCVGLNYRGHILEGQARGIKVAKFPERPEIGYRANNALIGQGDAIVRPRDFTGTLEYEGEAVAVIGKRLKKCSRDEAADAIFGWTIGNDISAREWQHGDRTFWRGKNCDTFKPMGPWIMTGFRVHQARTTVCVNGKETCSFATGEMIFDHIDYITEMSKYLTLVPGDIVWMGADCTGALQVGDTVEIDVSGLGTLRNHVVAERE